MADGWDHLPTLRIEASCHGCPFEATESYACQGDSGIDYYCKHPGARTIAMVQASQAVGRHKDSYRAPEWCPLLPAAKKRLAEGILGESSTGKRGAA